MTKNKIINGTIMSYIAIIINFIAALVYTPWMISKIGQGNYGLYILATSLISLLSVDFGLSSATTRFITKYLAEDDQKSINDFVGLVYKLYFLISIILLIVLVIIYFFIGDLYVGLNTSELSIFKVIFIIISIYTVISFPFITVDGILSAYEEFAKLKLCEIFNKLFTIFLIVLALLFNGGVIELVLVNAFVGVITICAKVIIIKRVIPIKVNMKYKDLHMFKKIFSFSFWVTLSSIFQRLIFNVTPSILGIVSNSIQMSLFGTASSLESYSFTFSNAIGTMFLPKVSRIIANDSSQKEIGELSIKVGRLQFYIIALIFIGFLLVGYDFVILWLGQDFSTVYICAILLILPCVFHTPQKIQQTVLIAKNYVKYESIAYFTMGIVNVILSFIFANYWGAIGASLSIFIAYIIRTVILNIIYVKKLKLDLFSFFKEVYLQNIPLVVFTILFGVILNFIFNSLSWGNLIIKGTFVVFFYCVFLWTYSFNNYEKGLVSTFINVLKKR